MGIDQRIEGSIASHQRTGVSFGEPGALLGAAHFHYQHWYVALPGLVQGGYESGRVADGLHKQGNYPGRGQLQHIVHVVCDRRVDLLPG